MTFTFKNKIYAAVIVAAAIFLATILGSAWSNHKIAKLEHVVNIAKQNAEASDRISSELEQKAAEYKQKIEYLETSLSQLETTARKQDEKLKELANDTNIARDSVRRARSVRTIESTNAELCTKLAQLGHPCGG